MLVAFFGSDPCLQGNIYGYLVLESIERLSSKLCMQVQYNSQVLIMVTPSNGIE